jgi:4-hydroxymandelate oxidase
VLDTVPASIDVLPEVVEAVDARVPVLFDSGIRRGVDVVKALALGASAVMLGRPYVWGLAVNGADGVRRVTHMLQNEFELAMSQCGARNLGELDASLVRRTWPLPMSTNRSLPNERTIPRSL